MKLEQSVRTELRYVAAGLAVADVVLCALFAALQKLDYTVPLGALWGSVFAFFNMYLLARRVQKLAGAPDEQTQQAAKKQLSASYFGRIMLMAFAIVVGVIVPVFHYVAVLIPFLIPQPVMMLRRALTTRRTNGHKGEC